ncbi:hypothetical protein KAR34_01510 [bacterium]|nr:hypothetical protein [bacterium]
MRILRRLIFGYCGLLFSLATVWAATPAADTAPFMKKKGKSIPVEKLVAEYKPGTIKLPPKPWKIPEATLDVTGRGISLYYLLPYQRVKNIIPASLRPYPGPDKIWFRVDFIQWTSLRPRSNPGKKLKRFVELAYRFEVKQGKTRGTFPLKIYLDAAWPVLWARHYGKYNAYPVRPADVNFSPFIHFFQMRKGKYALAVIEAVASQGIRACMNDIFNRREDTLLWLGNGTDFVIKAGQKTIRSVVRSFEVEIKSAEIKTLLLPEPVKWKILHQDEVIVPDKAIIIDAVYGTWTSEALPVKLFQFEKQD